MTAVLGIDAAWTEPQPSGVALLQRRDRPGDRPGLWRCLAVAPSYETFYDLAGGKPVRWEAPRLPGSAPDPERILVVASHWLGDEQPAVVAVDMPLSTQPITQRRLADTAVSREFGSRHCSTHSPTPERPGPMSEELRQGFQHAGYHLVITDTQPRPVLSLLEVYPHPALLSLLHLDERLPYKVSKSSRYWPELSRDERRTRLLANQRRIAQGLAEHIPSLDLPLPAPGSAGPLAGLKRYEDALDALVCAWVATRYLDGRAKPYNGGDPTAAIWVPQWGGAVEDGGLV